jgi:hypothetical protein
MANNNKQWETTKSLTATVFMLRRKGRLANK